MFFVFCLSLVFDQYCFFLISDGSVIGAEVTENYTAVDESQLSLSTKSPSDPTMIFFTMDYGTCAHLLTAPFHFSPLGGVGWTKNRSQRAFVCGVMGKYAWNEKIIWDNGIWVCKMNDELLGLCVWIGMGWKITMLILSSLALVLGTVILILNVYSNRWVPEHAKL